MALNAGLWIALRVVVPTDDRGASQGAIAFYLLLGSLIIMLFDRYHPQRRPAGLRRPVTPPPIGVR